MALARRLEGPSSSGLVAHSDRGSQYASEHDQRRLAAERITCGVSRRGNCRDDAPMGSFLASPEEGPARHEDRATRAGARSGILESVGAFDNCVRRHPSLGSIAPAEYERAHD